MKYLHTKFLFSVPSENIYIYIWSQNKQTDISMNIKNSANVFFVLFLVRLDFSVWFSVEFWPINVNFANEHKLKRWFLKM